jgi:EpsI family protein
MNRRFVASTALGVAMALTSALTGALTPRTHVASAAERLNLDTMIPASFSGWTVDDALVPLKPNPEQQTMLEKIYDQTLSRTYINGQGQRVMLSIAYGGDQSKALQLHLPEVCYVAQGFQMLKQKSDTLATRFGALPVKRLVARQEQRNEPITYWVTIGDKAVMSGIEQKIERLAYGLSGKIPDGMLVRVSTIQANDEEAYRVQDRFIAQMLGVMAARDRARLLGAAVKPG